MLQKKGPLDQVGFRISVLICAYTEERWCNLLDAVESIRHQTLLPDEIILIIDHNPTLFERVRAEILDVTSIENMEARGLSGARNSGIAAASGEIIAFMDEDATADKHWLEELCHHFNDHRILGVGGSILPLWELARPAWFPEEFQWVVGCTYRGLPEVNAPVRNLIGCNMAFRREVFQQVGLFSHGIGRVGTFPAGCEETEICIRAWQHNRQGVFLYEPRAQVHHHVPNRRATLRYFFNRCFAEGRSKALVTGMVGAKDGLSSERGYILRTLRSGIWRGLRETLKNGEPEGVQRAAAILMGLTTTVSGYSTGKAMLWRASRNQPGRIPRQAGPELVKEPAVGERLG